MITGVIGQGGRASSVDPMIEIAVRQRADRLTVGVLRQRLEGIPDHLTIVQSDYFGDPLYYELSSQPHQYLVGPHFMLTAPDRGEEPE